MNTRQVFLWVAFISLCAVMVTTAWTSTIITHLTNIEDDNLVGGLSFPELANYEGEPSYDSGWRDLGTRPDPIAVEFVHNLGGNPDEYLVSLECRDDSTIGTYDCTDQGFNVNAHWYGLTNSVIQVYASNVLPGDIRVRIYMVTPVFDTGWDTLGIRPDPIAVEIIHNLGGNPNDFLVSLECQDDTSLGTYDCTDQDFNVNAHWYGLGGLTVQIYATRGSRPDAFRLRIYDETPSYDSGWRYLGIRPDPIAVEFIHNLGGRPDDFKVTLECNDDSSLGTYDCTDQAFNREASWYGLTATKVQVFANGGSRPDFVRVCIWWENTIYLPVVFRRP